MGSAVRNQMHHLARNKHIKAAIQARTVHVSTKNRGADRARQAQAVKLGACNEAIVVVQSRLGNGVLSV